MSADKDGVELSKRSSAQVRHGHTVGREYSPTYQSWQSMLARCRYADRDTHCKHVGRGISCHPKWQNFEAFLADMGERPDGTTLDRIDNDGDYTLGNCRWATPMQQARNRRNSKLTFETAVEVAVAKLRGESAASIAKKYGTSESLPREVSAGRAWPDACLVAKEIVYGRS